MDKTEVDGRANVPVRALGISILALLVPVGVDLLLPPEMLGVHQPLLWLLAVIPAFLLAYFKGWQGAATSLAMGMATLSLTQAAASWMGRPVPDLMAGVVVAFVALCLGIGWLAERLHSDRAKVEDMAFTDLLTGLPNRRHARVFLENEFAAAERGRLLSVALFDLDSFKAYNDQFGHQAGDQALKAFADILSATTRRMNLSARFGGEEFLSILAGSEVEGALAFAERVRASLRSTRLPSGSLTVSAGVATFSPGMRSPDELLAAADHALYQAKREGRNRVRLFGRTLMEEAVAEAQTGPGGPGEPEGAYPRKPEEIGRSRPPVTLLPHQVTGFGVGRSVLLVEDEEAVRDLLASYLSKEGFEITTAEDVEAAIKHLGSEFDVVVTDLKLPGRWGMELVRAAKARWPSTQVLVITGVKDSRVTSEAMAAGSDAYLQKPFGMSELRSELQEALARRDETLASRSRSRIVTAEARLRMDVALEHVLHGTRFLVDAVEVRDPFIKGHHQRVTAYAREILFALDPEGHLIPPPSLSLGTRHLDIGKLVVPDQILNKTGPLTPGEMERIREHPGAGSRILKSLMEDETALEVISWHHERWDGQGYPDGLLGESIPLSARIAAPADVLDALTSSRPYREALSWDEALETIRAQEEGHFDPRVMDAFETALPRLAAIYQDGARERVSDSSRPPEGMKDPGTPGEPGETRAGE